MFANLIRNIVSQNLLAYLADSTIMICIPLKSDTSGSTTGKICPRSLLYKIKLTEFEVEAGRASKGRILGSRILDSF